ncbi:hypothetical protein H6P81_009612 [Aristolochia fimbriata]|uniref:Uncharacterized protein n=1 Tax=Aristolochia fimbriata TaxID=158543 RepID=A0AAV7ELF0_ARIFI|nr:hypothetical protein H6P81_009612 [Aristolochia fimbriata]
MESFEEEYFNYRDQQFPLEESSGKSSTKVEDDRVNSDELINDNPIEQVKLTVPISDDPTMAVLTFRTWVLGMASCALLAFLNQFFGYRQNALYISSVSAQIAVLPIGRLMAATLPGKPIRVIPFISTWSFSLNPGPFNLKEHVLITIFANCGATTVYAVNIVTIVKAFYRRKIHALAALLLTVSTQMLGYGWAGLFRKFLVDSPYMWWPSNLVQKRPKGGLTRLQFFLIVLVSSFAYYVVPNYLFPSITALSFICWIWENSVTAQQIGSGIFGLGLGSFALDWSTAAGFLGSPLATPAFAIINVMVGFFVTVYVLIPIAYWTNSFEAKKFPIFSSHVFDSDGRQYNVTRVLDYKSFSFDERGYLEYSPVNLSIFFVYIYGLSFATLAATLSHVALFHGKAIWQQTKATLQDQYGDIHTRLMKKNYEAVPQWWFYVIFLVVILFAMLACEGFGRQLQLPYWGILLACGLALIFTLPIGIITATTNQQPGLNVITELIIGFMYPGKPLANVAFKTYGYISMVQAITFLQDFKLGHYMKIPPKSMFLVQIYMSCEIEMHAYADCGNGDCFVHGAHGPARATTSFTTPQSSGASLAPFACSDAWVTTPKMYYMFLVGALAPLPGWALSRRYPAVKWLRLINMPIVLGATGMMPAARAVNYVCWGAVGFFFNFVVYRRYKGWWARHNYVLSAGLDAGVAFMAILTYVTLQLRNINGIQWWGLEVGDHCPLAHCPTAPGIVAEGCPVFT